MGSVNLSWGTSELVRPYLHQYSAGQTIFRQGSPGSTFMVVVTGSVDLVDDGKGTLVATLGPGDFLGEKMIFQDLAFPRQFTAKAHENAEILEIDRDHLFLLKERVPHFQELLVRGLVRRLDQTTQLLRILQIQDDEERLRQYLLFYRSRYEHEGQHIDVREVAHTLNMENGKVKKILSTFCDLGILRKAEDGMHLVNPLRLSKRE